MKHVIHEKLLVAVDFSEPSDVALEQAILLASQNSDFEIVLLWVDTKTPNYDVVLDADGLDAATRDAEIAATDRESEARTRLGVYMDRVKNRGIPVSARIEGGYADEVIVEVANDLSAVLTMVGTRGLTGFKRLLLGSVAEKVVRTSQSSVMVVRGEAKSFSRVLVATDFSAASEHALQVAVGLAAPDAQIDILHAWQYPPGTRGASLPDPPEGPISELRDQLLRRINKLGVALAKRYRGPGRTIEFINIFGSAAAVVHERLDSNQYDLVAMGTHGHRGFRRFLLGSVAEATVRHAPCSVLVTHDRSQIQS